MSLRIETWNQYDDGWIDVEASFWITGQQELTLLFFLPNTGGIPTDKIVAVFDGKHTHHLSVARGIEVRLPGLRVNGELNLQILSEYSEMKPDGDAREMLGVVVKFEAADGSAPSIVPSFGLNKPLHFTVTHPESEYIASSFDPTFYFENLGDGHQTHDPLLHYLVLGWRIGLDPNEHFSTNEFVNSSSFDSTSGLSPFTQFLLGDTPVEKGSFEHHPISEHEIGSELLASRPKDKISAASVRRRENSKKFKAAFPLTDTDITKLVNDFEGLPTLNGRGKFSACILALDASRRRAMAYVPCSIHVSSPPKVILEIGGLHFEPRKVEQVSVEEDVQVWRLTFKPVSTTGQVPETVRIRMMIGDEEAATTEATVLPRVEGRLERIDSDQVKGWIVDFNAPDGAPAEVVMHINGAAFARTHANARRADVAKLYPENAHCGFAFKLQPEMLPTGKHHVSVRTPDHIVLPSRVEAEILGLRHADALVQLPMDTAVVVVVPVYNAPHELADCVDSLMRNTSLHPGRTQIVLLDDASPDPEVASVLARYTDHPAITVVVQPQNLGYTGNINFGIEMAGNADVVLLNSDARVGPGWLSRLRTAGARRESIGTVTAFSDNAGAFSAPIMNMANPPPPGIQEDAYARAVMHHSQRLLPVVPTGSGFCMYIKRELLNDIGLFDAELFPRGYGEENEFCMRALHAGWENVVADDAMVFHERSASFKAAKDTLIQEASSRMPQLYPEYRTAVREAFLQGVEMQMARYAVARAREDTAPRPRVAFVIGVDSGGTPQTNMDLMSSIHEDFEPWLLLCQGAEIIVFRIEGRTRIEVERHALTPAVDPISHESPAYRRVIVDLLQRYCFELIHIRHIAHHGFHLVEAARRLDIPVIFSLHDFYTVCPNVKLLDAEGQHCGGRCTTGKGDCKVELWRADAVPPLRNEWIKSWQSRFSKLLGKVDHLVTTSPAARDIVREVYGLQQVPFSVIEHGRDFPTMRRVSTPLQPGEKLRIVVPGNVSEAKGLALIEAVHALDVEKRLEFHFFGIQQRDISHIGVNHGPYERDSLPDLIAAISPHVGAVLSIWPETYSHTLTELWSCGLPVLGSGLGATGERIRRHGGGWALDDLSPEAVYAKILQLATDPEHIAEQVAAVVGWQEGYGSEYGIAAMAARYRRIYWSLLDRGKPRAHVLALHSNGAGTDGRELGDSTEAELRDRFGTFRVNHLQNATPAAVEAIMADGVDAVVLMSGWASNAESDRIEADLHNSPKINLVIDSPIEPGKLRLFA